MLITAEWILPVSSAPIRDGGVLVDGERIVAVGPAADLAEHPLASTRQDFGAAVITPGLVNAHTHLTLTGLAGVIGPQPFTDWLRHIVVALRSWDVADHEASGIVGAEQCLKAGVTVVGDIAYGAAEVEMAAKAGLGGVFYWELLGMMPEDIDGQLEYLRYPKEAGAFGPRVICGLSPHSPYTSGPDLLRAVHDRARELGVPFALHVSESDAENELLRYGDGPLAGVASRTAFGFAPTGTSTTAYLSSLGILGGMTAIHLCYADENDLSIMRTSVSGLVTCPRSNAYLANPVPSARDLIWTGLAVGVGTDSAASNTDLDLMEEVRMIRDAEPRLRSEELLRTATLSGAAAIGVAESFGSLEPGKFADLAIFDIAGGDDPEQAVVDLAGAKTVRSVMSSGVWRVSEGELLNPDLEAAERTDSARERSLAALAESN